MLLSYERACNFDCLLLQVGCACRLQSVREWFHMVVLASWSLECAVCNVVQAIMWCSRRGVVCLMMAGLHANSACRLCMVHYFPLA